MHGLIFIRADASSKIGSGHVMRCLTLADALSELSNKVVFICKDHSSNLINKIIDAGYEVKGLSATSGNDVDSPLAHAEWLGGTQEDDAVKTIAAIKSVDVDWMIVDHYAIDECWHKKIRPHVKRIFVIDDLGDRKHDCDILLDQNLGATKEKYQEMAPKDCELLLGPQYALLRPEFARWREKSLERRNYVKEPKNILVSMGGVDPQNITANVISELSKISALADVEVNVVLGGQSPHIDAIEMLAKKSSLKISVHVDTKQMAELMSQADLSIGASGSSSWERCALGLPTISYVIADNQKSIARELVKNGASITIQSTNYLSDAIGKITDSLNAFSLASAELVDGLGTSKVIDSLLFKRFSLSTDTEDLAAINLSRLSRSQLIDVLGARNHPLVRNAMFSKKQITEEEHFSFIEELSLNKSKQFFAIYNDGGLIGVIYFTAIDWELHEATFGIYANLGRKVKCIGNKLMLVAEYIVRKLRINYLTLQVDAENLRAIKLYEKWGFVRTESFEKCGRVFVSYKSELL